MEWQEKVNTEIGTEKIIEHWELKIVFGCLVKDIYDIVVFNTEMGFAKNIP